MIVLPEGLLGPRRVRWILASSLLGATLTGLRQPFAAPIREPDYVAVAVSASDIVIVGTLADVRDSVASWASDSSHLVPASYLVMSHLVPVKGKASAEPMLVQVPLYGPTGHDFEQSAKSTHGRAVLYLRERKRGGFALARDYAPGHGFVPIAPRDERAAVARLRGLVARQSLEAVARRSDLIIIVGTPRNRERYEAGGPHEIRYTFAVDSVIAGGPAAHEIKVHCPQWLDMPVGKMVLMLTKERDGVRETVGYHAGIVFLEDQPDGRRGAPAMRILARIRAARMRGK